MQNIKTLILAVGCVVTALSLVSCKDNQAQETATPSVSIGAALPLSGNSASWGEKARDAILMAIDQKNAALKASGSSTAVIKFEDSKGDAAGGAAAIRALLDTTAPNAVIGGITSGETAAMIPLVTSRKVVLVSPTASATSLSGASPFFFRLWPGDSFETQAFASYLKDIGITELAVLYIQNEYGTGVKDLFISDFSTGCR